MSQRKKKAANPTPIRQSVTIAQEPDSHSFPALAFGCASTTYHQFMAALADGLLAYERERRYADQQVSAA